MNELKKIIYTKDKDLLVIQSTTEDVTSIKNITEFLDAELVTVTEYITYSDTKLQESILEDKTLRFIVLDITNERLIIENNEHAVVCVNLVDMSEEDKLIITNVQNICTNLINTIEE